MAVTEQASLVEICEAVTQGLEAAQNAIIYSPDLQSTVDDMIKGWGQLVMQFTKTAHAFAGMKYMDREKILDHIRHGKKILENANSQGFSLSKGVFYA